MTDLYTDGGLLSRNPSSLGCTAAFVAVREGLVIEQMAWRMTCEDLGLSEVSSNTAELLAAIFALRWIGIEQPGWAGKLHTDSEVTATRLRRGQVGLRWDMRGVTSRMNTWFRLAMAKVGKFEVIELGGHPTRADLAAGVNKYGLPVSRWNVLADKLCNRVKEVDRPLENLIGV